MPQTESPNSPVHEARRAQLRLALVPGIGPRLRQALLERFHTPEQVFAARPDEWRTVSGIGPKLSRALASAHDQIDVDAELELCRRHSIELMCEQDENYPQRLREIHDPPGVLYLSGTYLRQDEMAIGIVGSRHATRYGLEQAERLAAGLARAGVTVISGLARGIDAAAQRGALAAGGRTLAVLGSGLLNIYPPEHVELGEQVSRQGGLLSELPLRSKPLGGTFPQRNRLISGLSLGVLVIEASLRSGALITARHAAEQDRDVFALPGRVDNRMAAGCHRLIREGAKLVESVDDILEELGPLSSPAEHHDGQSLRHPAELLLNEIEQCVLQHVRTEPTPIDRVVAASGLPTPQVLATLSALEIRRLIARTSGSQVLRK